MVFNVLKQICCLFRVSGGQVSGEPVIDMGVHHGVEKGWVIRALDDVDYPHEQGHEEEARGGPPGWGVGRPVRLGRLLRIVRVVHGGAFWPIVKTETSPLCG